MEQPQNEDTNVIARVEEWGRTQTQLEDSELMAAARATVGY